MNFTALLYSWKRIDYLRGAVLAVERAVAVIVLLAVLPVLAVLAVCIFVLSGAPPVVMVRRAGWKGRRLRLLKLRTMWPRERTGRRWRVVEEIADAPVPEVKQNGDHRVTSGFARLCRRYSLDELPQLWHIVKGEMSFVGPRPLTPAELEMHYGLDAPRVLSMRPGLTGLWQTRGRSRLSYRQRRRFDLFLVGHNTPRLRASILLRTLPCVVTGKDAW